VRAPRARGVSVRRRAFLPACAALALTFSFVTHAADAQTVEASPADGALENTLASDVHSVVTTGHVGAVLDLQYDETRDLLFSAGEDGTVRVWDATDGALYRSLKVTRLAAQLIAVDPVSPRVAVVVSDGLRSFSLAVWDWEQEKQVLRIPLKDAPLFLRFSGQGSFLVYGQSSWQSLTILDASTGVPVAFHPDRLGMISFAEVSRSEKTIMTYQVSGGISYWDLATGGLALEVPTIPYLSHVRISRDRRYLVGSTGREVVLVDALSGAVRGRAPLNGEASVDISPRGDRVAAAPVAGGSLTEWTVGPDALAADPRATTPGVDPGGPFQVLCYGSDGLYLAGPGGIISHLSASGDFSVFSRNILADITGMDARRGLLAVGSRDWVRVFKSDLLEGAQSPGYVHSVLLDNPWKSPVGLSFVSDTSLVAWSRDDAAPRFAVLDLPDSAFSHGSSVQREPLRFRMLPSGFKAPLSRLLVTGSSLLGIESGGVIRVVDTATGTSRFETRVSALSCVVATSPGELIGGKNTALAAGGSLVRINTRTGETVAIPGRNVFTWDLVFDAAPPQGAGPTLYSLGVDAAGATNVLRHDGAGFERETVIASDPEEDLDASLALDPSTHILYASLGKARIVSWDGGKASDIPAEYGTLRRLTPSSGLILSLDRDSLLTIAEETSGSRLAEVSLFSDGEWAATVRGGGYVASPGGDAHVKVFMNGETVKATEDYRLRIESW
jgi:WD domain, G-beta repeat